MIWSWTSVSGTIGSGCNYIETITRDTVIVTTLDVLKTCHIRRKRDLILSSGKMVLMSVSDDKYYQHTIWHQKTETALKEYFIVSRYILPPDRVLFLLLSDILTELYRNNFNLYILKAVNTICHIWTWIRITARVGYSILETHSSLWVI